MDEINVRIEPVDEIIVSVLQDDDIEVSIEEAEEIEAQAFDYPPEIDQLNSRVAACEENSQNAVGLANAALETATESAELAISASEAANEANNLASQAAQTATSATEAASAAGNLASQAAQAAQEAAGIAEGAANTAGEAWTVIQNLSSRVTTLENDIQNYSITVSQDVNTIEFGSAQNPLQIPRGSTVILSMNLVYTVNTPSSVYRLELNDVVTGYLNGALSANAYIQVYTPTSESGTALATLLFDTHVTALISHVRKATGSNPTTALVYANRLSFPDEILNVIRIRTAESGKVIAAGSTFTLKIIK